MADPRDYQGRMEPRESRIEINGRRLTEAQAMAVRVAITGFHMETAEPKSRKDLGPIADAYHARLGEVLGVMLNAQG